VIVPIDPTKSVGNGWYPTGGDRIGCVLLDTKRQLGVSEEALSLMRRIPRNRDSFGDISWWACDDGTHAFSWLGAIHKVLDPLNIEASRDFHITDRSRSLCTIIPNEVPEIAQAAIDENSACDAWSEPNAIDY
jgi:hypothetical protein